MANVHGLNDAKKSGGGGRGSNPGGNPGGPGGFGFPGMGGGGGGFPFPNMGGNGPRANSDEGKVITVVSDAEFQNHLKKAGGKLVVVDFTASWCGPCKMIAPAVAALSNKYPNVVFLKVDVDELRETATSYGVRSMPTFQFFIKGSKVDEFSGADASKLESLVIKHQTSGASEEPSGGYTLGRGTGNSVLLDRFSSPSSSTPASSTPSQGQTLGGGDGGRTLREETQLGSQGSDADSFFVTQLTDMGFSEDMAKRAVRATGAKSIEDAVDWCAAHMDDESTSTPAAPSTSSTTSSAAPSDAAAKSEGDATPSDPMDTSASSSERAPTEHNALCDSCKQKIIGIRWKCTTCSDYDLCSDCYGKRTHNSDHLFDAYEYDISDPVKKPLTPEELAERTRLYAEKAKQIREKKAREEELYKRESEKNRIKQGKEAAEIKKSYEQKQKERERYLAKKEKEDARIAKEKIMKKIEQDKRERESAKKAAEGGVSTQAAAPVAVQAAPVETVKKEYTEALIQFRTPDGVLLKATFKPTDTIRTVHGHISLLLGNDRVTLSTTYPRKTYSPNGPEMNETLAQAQCVPSGTFVVR